MNLRIASLALSCFVAATGITAAEDEQRFSTDPSGILELAGQSRLVIERIPGNLYVRVGKSGELRYMARSLTNRREERPVALWLRGRSMILRAAEGHESVPLMLEVAVSPGVAVELDLLRSRVSVSDIQGSVKVRADDTELEVRGLEEDLDLDLEGGRVVVEGVGGALEAELQGVDTRLLRVAGPVTVVAQDSEIELSEALDEVEIDADGGTVSATTVGRLDAGVRNGELRVSDARGGGELRLEGAELHLTNSQGEFIVETDAAVTAEGLQGALRLSGFGSGVRGTKITGEVEVVTDQAPVALEEIDGPVRVRGSGLQITLNRITGEVRAETTTSTLHLDQIGGAVEIKAEFGDVDVYNATREVKIDSREGNVRVINLSGPVQLKAEGDRVDVAWETLEGESGQSVENSRGDVFLSFPARAQGTLEARASDGTIQSSVSGVYVSRDGSTASGSLGGGPDPLVRASSGGDLHLMSRRTPQRPAKAPPAKVDWSKKDDQ